MRTLVNLPYRFVLLALDQQLTLQKAWTVLAGSISSRGGAVKAQCAPLLSFLRAAAVEESAIPFATADLEVVIRTRRWKRSGWRSYKGISPRALTLELRGAHHRETP